MERFMREHDTKTVCKENSLQVLDDGSGVLVGLGLAAKVTGEGLR